MKQAEKDRRAQEAALDILQLSWPYRIQTRSSTVETWAAFILPEHPFDQPIRGKERAFELMNKYKELYPERQFRMMTQSEADYYLAGVADACLPVRNRSFNAATGRTRKFGNSPLMALPDNL